MKDPKKGFTLIELLVVISIISLLSSIVLASLTEVRKKARDTKRVAEVQQIQTQLELYYNENGAYPIRNWTSSNDSGSWSTFSQTLNLELPVDPVNSGTAQSALAGNYTYSYYGSSSSSFGCQGQWYMFVYRLETDANLASPGIITCNGTNFNYGGTRTVGSNVPDGLFTR